MNTAFVSVGRISRLDQSLVWDMKEGLLKNTGKYFRLYLACVALPIRTIYDDISQAEFTSYDNNSTRVGFLYPVALE